MDVHPILVAIRTTVHSVQVPVPHNEAVDLLTPMYNKYFSHLNHYFLIIKIKKNRNTLNEQLIFKGNRTELISLAWEI